MDSKDTNDEPTLYTKSDQQGNMLIIFLYVDDTIFKINMNIVYFKYEMKSEFEMTYLVLMKCFLGIEVEQSKNAIFKFAKINTSLTFC